MNNPMSGPLRPGRSVHSRLSGSVLLSIAMGVAHGQSAPEAHAVGAPIHSFSVSPAASTVQLRGHLQLAASNSEAVVWEVNGIAGGSAETGTITQSGLYTAPGSLAKSSGLVVTARPISDPQHPESALINLASGAVYYVATSG